VVDPFLAIVNYRHRTSQLIQKDIEGLSRLPEHLTVVISLQKEDDALHRLMDEVAELAAWSACAGIPTLSIYEKKGLHIFDLVKKIHILTELIRHPKILYSDALPCCREQTLVVLRIPFTAASGPYLPSTTWYLLPFTCPVHVERM
jgi:hypothetical protein